MTHIAQYGRKSLVHLCFKDLYDFDLFFQSTMLVHSMKTSGSPSSTMSASSIKPTRTTQQVTNGTPSVEDSEEVWQIAVYALVAALGKKSTFSKNP